MATPPAYSHRMLKGALIVILMATLAAPVRAADGDAPFENDLLRLSESLIFEFLGPEFSAGTLTPTTVRPMLHRLGGVLVNAGKYSGPHAELTGELARTASWGRAPRDAWLDTEVSGESNGTEAK